ncbi:5548_t:CDS:2 [Gigaspora rosea]|nr:5548_t:CDS:2 [Gigaspora rosea]
MMRSAYKEQELISDNSILYLAREIIYSENALYTLKQILSINE